MFLKSLNTPASGLTAQQYRFNIIAENITNVETTRTSSGKPYRRKTVEFEALSNNSTFADRLEKAIAARRYSVPDLEHSYAINSETYQGRADYIRHTYPDRVADLNDVTNKAGVRVRRVIEDPTPNKAVYDPAHPDADEDGYVYMPNVEMAQEMVDMMGASRSYEANVQVINAIKAMAAKALEIGR